MGSVEPPAIPGAAAAPELAPGAERGGRKDIRRFHVDRPALRLKERHQRPDLLRREDAAHLRHDRLITRHDVGARAGERLVEIGFAVFAGLALAAARPDRPLSFSSIKRFGARVPRP